eukprot:1157705-Pelagomonas_calceolata.AAC.4
MRQPEINYQKLVSLTHRVSLRTAKSYRQLDPHNAAEKLHRTAASLTHSHSAKLQKNSWLAVPARLPGLYCALCEHSNALTMQLEQNRPWLAVPLRLPGR